MNTTPLQIEDRIDNDPLNIEKRVRELLKSGYSCVTISKKVGIEIEWVVDIALNTRGNKEIVE